MDPDKLIICTEEDFQNHRNALDVVNFEKLEDLADDDHLVIPTGKNFWESLGLVGSMGKSLMIGNARPSEEEEMDVCTIIVPSAIGFL
jgi:hypothetical protein